MKKTRLLLTLTIIPTITAMPLISASCDWLYDKPKPTKPNNSYPNDLPKPKLPKIQEVKPEDRFDTKLLYSCPVPAVSDKNWDGPHQLWHYVVNIHKLKVLDSNGKETNEYESKEQKLQRYAQAKTMILNYSNAVEEARNKLLGNWWDDLFKKSKEEYVRKIKNKKVLQDDPNFLINYEGNYQYFTESRIKDKDPLLLSFSNETIKEIREQNIQTATISLGLSQYIESFMEIRTISDSLFKIIDLFTFMINNINDPDKTFLEQLQAMGPEKLDKLKFLIKKNLTIEQLIGNIKIALELDNKLYVFPAPIVKNFYDKAGHYNKIIDALNEFYNPLAFLLGFITETNDFFWNNPNYLLKNKASWYDKYLFNKYEYGSNPNGFKIKTLKHYNAQSAFNALSKWLDSNKTSLGLKYSSIK